MEIIEVRGFGKLYALFKERGWDNPFFFERETLLSAEDLRKKLEIAAENVEVVFINRTIKPLQTLLKNGDRVAFVPPGVPTIHRFNLGFYDRDHETSKKTRRRAAPPAAPPAAPQATKRRQN